jgi:hypothetical protein
MDQWLVLVADVVKLLRSDSKAKRPISDTYGQDGLRAWPASTCQSRPNTP